jgi:hypothetical protein
VVAGSNLAVVRQAAVDSNPLVVRQAAVGHSQEEVRRATVEPEHSQAVARLEAAGHSQEEVRRAVAEHSQAWLVAAETLAPDHMTSLNIVEGAGAPVLGTVRRFSLLSLFNCTAQHCTV